MSSADNGAGESLDKTAGKRPGKASGNRRDKNSDKNSGKSAGKSFGKSSGRSSGRSAGKGFGTSFGKISGSSSDNSFGSGSDNSFGSGSDTSSGTGADNSSESSSESSSDSSSGTNADKATDKISGKKGLAARKLAVAVLVKVEREGAFANLALANALKGDSLSQRDKAFVMALVLGVLRNQKRLDTKLAALSKEPLIKLKPGVRSLLRLAIYQLDHMQDIPESAVVDTAVELGRMIGHVGISRYINGVLRTYVRERPDATQRSEAGDEEEDKFDLRYQDIQSDDNFSGNYSSQLDHNQNSLVDVLSERYSMPSWLVSRWLDRFGEKESLALLAACQSPPKLTLRVNETACETTAFAQLLSEKGIKVKRSALVPSCLTVVDRRAARGPIENIPGWSDGIFSVQDESAAFVSQIVDPRAGEQVIDLCAAPGGKTLNLAVLMGNLGKVIAVDKNENRLNLIKTNRQRLKLTNIEIILGDSTNIVLPLADKVLVDAPCSGTGVINKRADIRLKRTKLDITSLVALQKDLLRNAAKLVKEGGSLIYSTCSIEQEENEDIFSWFLSNFKDFQADDLSPFFPEGTLASFGMADQARHGYCLFLPSKHDVSGFFVSRFKRRISPETRLQMEQEALRKSEYQAEQEAERTPEQEAEHLG